MLSCHSIFIGRNETYGVRKGEGFFYIVMMYLSPLVEGPVKIVLGPLAYLPVVLKVRLQNFRPLVRDCNAGLQPFVPTTVARV